MRYAADVLHKFYSSQKSILELRVENADRDYQGSNRQHRNSTDHLITVKGEYGVCREEDGR